MLPSFEIGTANPVFLFLHHFGGAARQWMEVMDQLAPTHRCIAVDMPGFGEARFMNGFTVDEMADHLDRFVKSQELKSYFLVGHSMTGKVALVHAARHSPDLLGLILVTPSPPGPEPIEDEARSTMLREHGTRVAAEELIDKITANRLPQNLYERAVEDNLRASPNAWEAWLKQGSYEDCSKQVGILDLPALVVTGQNDPALPASVQRSLTLPHLSQVTLEDIPNCGHLPPLEAAHTLSSLLRNFAREIVDAS